MFTNSSVIRRAHRIMSSAEVRAICEYTNAKWDRWGMARKGSCIIFRLATCCGLRRKEIVGLDLSDIIVDGPKPVVIVRASTTKAGGGRVKQSRAVPLNWSPGTLAYLNEWKKDRIYESGPSGPCIRSYSTHTTNYRISGWNANVRFKNLVRVVLGEARATQISLHDGRHTFVTHSLYAGRPIHVVAAAAGHANLSTTQIYAHLVADLDEVERPPVFSI